MMCFFRGTAKLGTKYEAPDPSSPRTRSERALDAEATPGDELRLLLRWRSWVARQQFWRNRWWMRGILL